MTNGIKYKLLFEQRNYHFIELWETTIPPTYSNNASFARRKDLVYFLYLKRSAGGHAIFSLDNRWVYMSIEYIYSVAYTPNSLFAVLSRIVKRKSFTYGVV